MTVPLYIFVLSCTSRGRLLRQMAQVAIPYLHSESELWIFGQNIVFSDSGCFRSPLFRSLNMAMAQPDGNLLAQACAGNFLQRAVRKERRSECDRSEGGHMSAAVRLSFQKHEFPFLFQPIILFHLTTLLICFYTHCMICHACNYRKLLF